MNFQEMNKWILSACALFVWGAASVRAQQPVLRFGSDKTFKIAQFTDMIPVPQYIYGIQTMFVEWYVWYAIIKSLFFSVVITSVASFYGYNVKGGALDVGNASTNSVVASSILILLLDVLLTKLLLQ